MVAEVVAGGGLSQRKNWLYLDSGSISSNLVDLGR